MNRKPCLLLIGLSILIVFSLTSCNDGDAKVVTEIPDGFVNLIELNNSPNNILRCVLWDTQISFMDDLGYICIYQDSFVNNQNLIVKYKDEYYINEMKYLEFNQIAILAREERQRTYKFGDEVEILSSGGVIYTVKIISLEVAAIEQHNIDNFTIYDIKYTLSSNVTENKQIKLNASVETKTGVEYSNLDFNDKGTMSVKIRERENDKIVAIILCSPEYPGLTYRIVVDESF